MNLPAQIQEKLNQRQTQAVIVGILILVVIALLQLTHDRNSQPLVALLESQQHLGDRDLERMEFAIGKAGICGCEIENGLLMVPSDRKQECLNAIAENDALPQFLREETREEPSVNPFLSRSQQKQIESARKKRLVREMVIRLPFVRNAWFEMDSATGGSVFQPSQQTAVISIEPPADVLLDPAQVATVREMIAGSIAGLPAENIRVIDVTSGYAHRPKDPRQQVLAIDQREPFEQETYYRRRIQQAVEPWGDIEVQVRVNRAKVASVTQNAAYTRPVEPQPESPVLSVIGTNSSASISDFEAPRAAPRVVRTAVVALPRFTSRVEVMLQVPETAADNAGGEKQLSVDDPNVKKQAIAKLGRTLVETVKPILPANSFAQGTPFPISVQFVPDPTVASIAKATWQEQARQWFGKHWPSAAVLLAGLVLITLMTRQHSFESLEKEEANADIISINSATGNVASQDQRTDSDDLADREAAEKKLESIVEKDPESAARVIESWVRNAG